MINNDEIDKLYLVKVARDEELRWWQTRSVSMYLWTRELKQGDEILIRTTVKGDDPDCVYKPRNVDGIIKWATL